MTARQTFGGLPPHRADVSLSAPAEPGDRSSATTIPETKAGVAAPSPQAGRDILWCDSAEDALRQLRERLDVIFKGVETGIFLIDPESHRIVDANPVALSLVGASIEKVRGAVCHKFVCPADTGRCPVTDLGQTVDNSERVLLTSSGERRDIIKTVRPVDIDGRPHLLESFLDISDRKKAEEKLAEKSAYLNTLFEISPLGIIVLDRDGRIQMANSAFEQLFEHSRDQLQGACVSELLAPEELAAESRSLIETCLSGSSVHFITRRMRRDQTLLDVEINAVPLEVPGKPPGVLALYHDVTVRARTEEEMAERHRLATLGAEVGIALAGAVNLSQGIEVCATALVRNIELAFARIWILNPDSGTLELRGSAGDFSPDDREVREAFGIDRLAACGEPQFCAPVSEGPGSGPGVGAGLEGFAALPLRNGNQTLGVGAVFARHPLTEASLQALESTMHSLTQFIERQRAEAGLRASEERYRDLFENASDPVCTLDLELRITSLNRLAECTLGYSREEARGLGLSELVEPDQWQRIVSAFTRLANGERPEKFELDIRNRERRRVRLEINPRLIRRDDEATEIQCIARDITGRDVAEMELRQAQKLESVGRLASGIAHEINTPMQFVGDNVRFLHDAFGDLRSCFAAIQGSIPASDADDAGPFTEFRRLAQQIDMDYLLREIPEALEQTQDGVERVVTIVRALKEFAHPDSKGVARADMNKALLNTLTVARNELKYVADVETDFGDLPPVLCSLGDMNQVFLNLLVNAAHAIGDVVRGTEQKGKIRIHTEKQGARVLVAISDTGSGIPENIRERIFDPFFTTKEVGRGTGQGLAIARSVVERHKGTLTFESEVGRGTTFFISLPVESA